MVYCLLSMKYQASFCAAKVQYRQFGAGQPFTDGMRTINAGRAFKSVVKPRKPE
jgi:hypothetical protein